MTGRQHESKGKIRMRTNGRTESGSDRKFRNNKKNKNKNKNNNNNNNNKTKNKKNKTRGEKENPGNGSLNNGPQRSHVHEGTAR